MRQLIAAILIISLFGPHGLSRAIARVQVDNGSGLSLIAAQRDFFIGTAVSMSPFSEEPVYREGIEREFNLVVAENAFKFQYLHPARDRYDFKDSDALVEFAERNRMKVRGHTLVWHSQLPQWLTEGTWSREEARSILKDHIQTVVGRYKGRIWAWDVVNEAIDERQKDGLRRDSFWYRVIGPDYVALALRTAREVDPEAMLYYNDFSNEGRGKKSDVVFRLLRGLKRQGVPVDGIGWQMHIPAGFKITTEHRENAKRLTDLGLELSITELDVRVTLPLTQDAEKRQAETYGEVATFCLKQPGCRALVMWGFSDKHSWIPSVFAGTGKALVLDEDYRPKLAYSSLRESLTEAVTGAPKISSATIADGTLVLEGENIEQGSTLVIDGKPVKPTEVEAPTSLRLRNIERLVHDKATFVLQLRSETGKLSIARRFAMETGMLSRIVTRYQDQSDPGRVTLGIRSLVFPRSRDQSNQT